jgi:hypothetical protein
VIMRATLLNSCEKCVKVEQADQVEVEQGGNAHSFPVHTLDLHSAEDRSPQDDLYEMRVVLIWRVARSSRMSRD